MPPDAIQEAGRYAVFIWGSYGAVLAVFVWNVVAPKLRRRQLLLALRDDADALNK